jgi:hypothetical protein
MSESNGLCTQRTELPHKDTLENVRIPALGRPRGPAVWVSRRFWTGPEPGAAAGYGSVTWPKFTISR